MENSVFNVGDVVVEVPAFVGQKVTGQEFTIIATYRNANGFWHVAETVDVNGLKVQEPLNDGGPYLHRVKEATTTTKPINTTAKVSDSDALKQDFEKIEADFRRVFGFIGKFSKVSAFTGLPREMLHSQWYSLHSAETGKWQIRTGPITEHPLGFVMVEIEFEIIADHIVAVHNRWYRGYQTYGED